MKIRILAHTAAVAAILVIQTTVLEYFRVLNVKPNLIMIYTICAALLNGYEEGAAVGFFSGMALDMLSGKNPGLHTLLGLYLGLSIGLLNKRLYRENIPVAVFFTFISTIVYEWMVYFLNNFGYSIKVLYPLKHIILPEAVYNSIAVIIMFILAIRLNRYIDKRTKYNGRYG